MFQEEEGEEGGRTGNVVAQEQDAADVREGGKESSMFLHAIRVHTEGG